jgi:hypothetical protein
MQQALKQAVLHRDHGGRGNKKKRNIIFVHFRFRPLPLSNPSYSTHTAPGCYAYAQTAAHRALVDLHLLRAFDDSVKLRVTLGVLEPHAH